MAGRHIKDLITAYRDRDDLLFRRAAQAIIEEEESKRHTALARELRHLLASGSGLHVPAFDAPMPEPPRDRDSALPLVEMSLSDKRLCDLTFESAVAGILDDLTAEVDRWPTLDAMAVPRRNRVLLHGPPGCGKTSIAEAMAGELGRILVTVRIDSLVSSFLGETASNLRRVFDFASSGAYVVLFDEFDSLAKDRNDPSDHGELRRVVNAVLQLIDRYCGPSILIAATNDDVVLDDAIWRRFDEVVAVPLPDREQMRVLMQRLLEGRSEKVSLSRAVGQLDGLPYAAGEAVVNAALRGAVAADRTRVNQKDLDEAVQSAKSRRWG